MDGVLADFDRGIEELCHMKRIKQGEKNADVIWDAVSRVDKFYDKLEPIAGAVEMFHKIYEKYGSRCEILSAVPKPHRNIHSAREDKYNWVRRILSDTVTVNLVYRAEKKEYVKGKNYILIDDYEKNIHEWELTGGTGILFDDPVNVINKILELDTD